MAHPRQPIIEAGWLAVLALTPVLVNPWADQPIDPAKAATVRLLVLAMLGGWLLSPPRAIEMRPRALMGLVLGWLAVHTLSTMTSIAPAVSLLGEYERGQGVLTTTAYAVLLLLVGTGLTSGAQRERAVTVILIASVPVALYAIVQRFGLDPLGLPSDRPASTLGGPIFLGAYLLMAAPLALARLLDGMRRERRRAFGIAVPAAVFALQSAALLLALSRGPFLGFVAALVTLAVLDVRIGGARRVGPWVAGGFVAILLALAGGSDFSRFLQPGGATSRVRVLIWEATMRLAGPHAPLWSPVDGDDRLNTLRPFIGYGPECLYAALAPFHPDELAHLEPGAKADRAHNALLDALGTTGALGAISYLTLVIGVIVTGLRRLGIVQPGGVRRFIAWCVTGATSAALLAAALVGAAWIVPAVGWGLVAGTLAFVACGGRQRGAGDLVAAALLAGVVGHIVETQVGIATTTSWVHFSFFAGALAAGTDPGTPDESDRIVLYGLITGLILSALVFQLLAADRWWAPGTVILIGGTGVAALLLTSAERGVSPREAGWLALLAFVVPVAFALPEARLVRRITAGQAAASVYAVLLFVAFAAIAVALAARALHGARRRSAAPPSVLTLAGVALVLLFAMADVVRLGGAVLERAAVRSTDPVEQRIGLLERARRLQPLAPRTEALLGAAYLSLAGHSLPQHALARAEEALLSARRIDPLDGAHTLDLARLQRAAARLVPAQAMERMEKAVAYYEAAARLEPAGRNVHLERAAALADQARLLARAGDLRAAADARDRARAARVRARQLRPTSANARASGTQKA